MSLQAATRATIEHARDRYPHARSAILPALWAVQHELGEITPDAMGEVAGLLRVTPSEVEAVSTFYSMYFQHPHGRHEVIVCINVSCALRGADEIVEHIERRAGCRSGETTADGAFTWSSTVECLGGCGGAPTMQVDHHFQENLTNDRIDEILGALRETPPAAHGGHAVEAVGTAVVVPAAPPDTSPVAKAPRAPRKAPVAETPLNTPKEPDPAAVTKPVAKPRTRRATKDGQ
jgi:NADH-quinone oxidoreductase subunit E